MKITELQIGDWVYYGEEARYPMQVVSIFGSLGDYDGTVDLDFEGNPGDVFESDVKDIFPIPITEEFLAENGFKKEACPVWKDYEVESTWSKYTEDSLSVCLEKYPNEEGMVFGYGSCLWNGVSIRYVHELQNVLRMVGVEPDVKI